MPITEKPVSWRFEIDLPELGDEFATTEGHWELHDLQRRGEDDAAIMYDGLTFQLASPLRIDAEAVWAGESLAVTIRLECGLSSQCSRCLEPAHIEILEDFMYLYSLRQDLKKRGTEEEADEFRTVRVPCWKGALDLSDQVFESLVLALPSRVLCAPDCRGICPGCGKSLNREECVCATQEIDPRFEGLTTVEFERQTE